MENLYINTIPIAGLPGEIEKMLVDVFLVTNINLQKSIHNLKEYVKELKDDLFVHVEYPYVDKVYRDSYYNYFASKKDDYSRNSIRLSFFSEDLKEEDFRDSKMLDHVQSCYKGFLVIRPTFPFIIGRSVISPQAFKSNNVLISSVSYSSTANAIKLKVSGFPHSSQDSETISCAEATVWSIMEYFGNRYPEYTPILPSLVNSVLEKFSFERLIPSKGLTAQQISYALKELGFGVKIYSQSSYISEFFELLRIYVESGIPVVGLIQNDKGIGHAVNIVGRKKPTGAEIDAIPVLKTINGTINVHDFAQLDIDYVCVDDNYPPYRTCTLSKPASYYTNPLWADCRISSFIVPLYPKIYLEAGEARKIAITLIEEFTNMGIVTNREILIKTFLASSRSFKNEIALNDSLQTDAKELLLSISMPKFIWVTEIGDKAQMKAGNVSGMMILDATEPKRAGIIAALIENNYIANDLNNLKMISLPLHSFKSYQNNLK